MTMRFGGEGTVDLDAAPVRLSFDIEIANEIELTPGEDLADHGPFDISCAAAADERGGVRLWFETDVAGEPCGHLSPARAREMLAFLRDAQRAGVTVYAWNGLAFDVRWLSHAANDQALAREVALDLVDPMFQFFVQRGFPIGLAAVAEGLGIGETKLMSGAAAPQEWARGNRRLVLEYVAGDCRMTDKIVAAILGAREVRWRTRRGTLSREPMPALLPVRELLHAPEPDTSWMSSPIPRTKFTGWLGT